MKTGFASAARRPAAGRPVGRPAASRSTRLDGPESISGGLYSIVLIDVVASAALTPRGQRRMRRDLDDLVREVMMHLDLDLDVIPTTDTGDGLRLLLDAAQVKPTRVVDVFTLGMAIQLGEHRQGLPESARIRLRVALDLGVVQPHLRGWVGDPLVRVARLVEAEPLRAALRDNGQLDLATVVSDTFFETVVRPGAGYVRSSCFRPVPVTVKEYVGRAWLVEPGAAGACRRCAGAGH